MAESDRARKRPVKAGQVDGETQVRETIAALPDPDRAMAERLHEIILGAAPALSPRTWYNMPAYYKDGKVVCFFQSGMKFKTRYSTFGFQQDARLDDGEMWPVAFALTELTPAAEERIAALVKKAAG